MECSVNQMASHLFNDGNSQDPSWGWKKISVFETYEEAGIDMAETCCIFSAIKISDLILHYYVLENDDLILADLIHLFFLCRLSHDQLCVTVCF